MVPGPVDVDMLSLLLLFLLCVGSLQEHPGYRLELPESVTVQEGLCVTVPCTFSYPWENWYTPATLYISWFWNGDDVYYDFPVLTTKPHQSTKDTNGRFQLRGNPHSNSCSLSISDARKSDMGTYFFRVERGSNVKYNYRDKKLNLHVTDLTEKPDIHILEPLTSGHPTKLTCSLPVSCKEERLLTVSWKGDALTMLDSGALMSSELTLTPRPQDHDTNLTCQVTLRRSQIITERTIRLNVSYAPENLSIKIFKNGTAFQVMGNVSSLSIQEGQSLRLVCVADSNPPAVLSWFQGSLALNGSNITKTGDLELLKVRTENEGEFTCRAQNLLGSQNISVNLSVLYSLQLLEPSCSWEDKGLLCTCSAQAWPLPSLRWWIGTGLVDGNSSNASFSVTSSSTGPSVNSSLRLHKDLSNVLRLCCEASNDHGKQSITVLVLPGKSASRAELVLWALGGVGATIFFFLCLCLIVFCIVKARRKQVAGKPGGMDDEDPVMGTVTWSCRQKPLPKNSADQVTASADTPPLTDEQEELHYASLSFHGEKSQQPKDQEVPSISEYSEIKKSK